MNTEVSRRAFMATLAGAAAVATALPQRSWASAPMLYGPSASVVKLNANENPYGPSPKALDAITKSAAPTTRGRSTVPWRR
jgi:histidinol-phosphate aminotransferase